MRFVIATILIILNGILVLSTAPSLTDKNFLFTYVFGCVLLIPSIIASFFCIQKKHRNNKRFFKIFNFICFISLIGGVVGFLKMYNAPPKIVHGEKGLIELTVPDSWRHQSQSNTELSINMHDKFGVTTLAIRGDNIGDMDINAEEASDIFVNNLREQHESVSISTLQPCAVNGFDCVYREFYLPNDEFKNTSLLAFLKGDRYVYTFIASARTDLYDKEKLEIMKILQSIKEK